MIGEARQIAAQIVQLLSDILGELRALRGALAELRDRERVG